MTSTIIIKQSKASAAEVARQSLTDRDMIDVSNDLPKFLRDGAIADAVLEFFQS